MIRAQWVVYNAMNCCYYVLTACLAADKTAKTSELIHFAASALREVGNYTASFISNISLQATTKVKRSILALISVYYGGFII